MAERFATDRALQDGTGNAAPVMHPCPPDPACAFCNGERKPAWDFLDGVYCISLQSRQDRVEQVAGQFHRAGLCSRVIFYRPTRHPKKGIIGSWESHQAVAAHARQRGCKTTLICEDDVLFVRRMTARRVRSIGDALRRLPEDWTIFYLGHWPLWAYFVRRNVLRTASACAHAYIASPRLLEWLRDHPYGAPAMDRYRIVGRALDAAYSKLPGTFALFPMVAIQSVSPSDNFNYKPKPKTKLKHFVTRSKYREFLLSGLMRPAEFIVVLLSPFSWMISRLGDRRRHRPGADG